MSLKTYTIKQGQSIFDVAVDIYGDVSYAIPLIQQNPELDNVSNTSIAGVVIEYEEPTPTPFKPVKIVQRTVFNSVTIGKDQTIEDIALQLYGSIERVFDVIALAGVDNISSDVTGITIRYTPDQSFIPKTVAAKNIKFATKNSTQSVPPPIETFIRITESNEYRITESGDYRIIE
jgi:hypothetical protein